MTITINTNRQALNIQNNLSSSTDKMNKAMERMSSGYKINSAADDAAGYAVTVKLSTTISSSKVASNNVDIGQSLLSTTEGNLETISTNLSRIRDLTMEASNGTYSSEDLTAISEEVYALVSEVNNTASTAKFNNIKLFDSATTGLSGITLQVGTRGSITTYTPPDYVAAAWASGFFDDIVGSAQSDPVYAEFNTSAKWWSTVTADGSSTPYTIAQSDQAMTDILSDNAHTAAMTPYNASAAKAYLDNYISTHEGFGGTTTTVSGDELKLDASLFKNATAADIGLFNVPTNGAYAGDLQVLDSDGNTYVSLYAKGSATALKASDLSGSITALFSGDVYTVSSAGTQDSTTKYSISNFLNNCDAALSNITGRIASLGAYENRLESAADNLNVQQSNLTAAKMTIKDADVAEESALYVNSQILQSATASLLVQANSAPQVALTLINGQ